MTAGPSRHERALLGIAAGERRIYGRVISRDAREAVAAERKRTAAARKAAASPAVKPAASRGSSLVATLLVLLVLATIASAGIDGLLVMLQHGVTIPARCQSGSPAYGPQLAICSARSEVQSCLQADCGIFGLAVLAWLLGLPRMIRKNSARYAGTEGSA